MKQIPLPIATEPARTFDSFVPGTNCKAWLFKILYSVFINRSRKSQREPEGVS